MKEKGLKTMGTSMHIMMRKIIVLTKWITV